MTESARAMHRIRLNYDGTFLEIRSDNTMGVAWLVEFLEPSFAPTADGINDFLINFQINQAVYSQLAYQAAAENCTELECFSNDDCFAHFPSWQDAKGVIWIHSSTDQVIIAILETGTIVQVVASGNTDRNRLALMRVAPPSWSRCGNCNAGPCCSMPRHLNRRAKQSSFVGQKIPAKRRS